ncbi:hypothetical protein DID80_00090 [Candidatus Marinamargulisbacteria bacterium SCGC AAA071-K20]|nr:hypothetical protein DID80_00090 [Candidatus Marinamargulisbacteria bacterium SCGC AAA071-K20]
MATCRNRCRRGTTNTSSSTTTTDGISPGRRLVDDHPQYRTPLSGTSDVYSIEIGTDSDSGHSSVGRHEMSSPVSTRRSVSPQPRAQQTSPTPTITWEYNPGSEAQRVFDRPAPVEVRYVPRRYREPFSHTSAGSSRSLFSEIGSTSIARAPASDASRAAVMPAEEDGQISPSDLARPAHVSTHTELNRSPITMARQVSMLEPEAAPVAEVLELAPLPAPRLEVAPARVPELVSADHLVSEAERGAAPLRPPEQMDDRSGQVSITIHPPLLEPPSGLRLRPPAQHAQEFSYFSGHSAPDSNIDPSPISSVLKELAYTSLNVGLNSFLFLASAGATSICTLGNLSITSYSAFSKISEGKNIKQSESSLHFNLLTFSAVRLSMIFCPEPVSYGIASLFVVFNTYTALHRPPQVILGQLN